MLMLSRKLVVALSLSTMSLPAMADAPAADTTVVGKLTVGGKVTEITIGDLKKYQKSLPEEVRAKKLEEIYDILLKAAIDMKIMEANAAKKGYDKDKEVLDEIEQLKSAVPTRKYIQEEVAKLQIDPEMKKAYDEAIKILPDVDEVSFSQAVFRDKPKAEAFIKELKANRGDFKKTLEEAQAKDQDVKGGDMDYTKLPELPPSLADAMKKSAKAVVIDKPIEEKLGKDSIYFVAKVKDKRPAKKPTFEEAKPELKQITMAKFAQDVIERDRKAVDKIETFGMDGKPLPAAEALKAAEAPKVEAAPAA